MEEPSDMTRVVTHLENQLETHIKTTNSKLDILIELTRQMATMQERQNSHSNDIQRLEKSIVEARLQSVSSLETFSQRFLALESEKSVAFEKMMERLEANDNKAQANIETRDRDNKAIIASIEQELDALDKDYREKYNFSKGAMWVVGGILLLAQGYIMNTITEFTNQSNANADAIEKIEARLESHPQPYPILVPK